ncbi:hypothetical protein HK096_010537, partial [Nowakowskiella sp. JEL0078]
MGRPMLEPFVFKVTLRLYYPSSNSPPIPVESINLATSYGSSSSFANTRYISVSNRSASPKTPSPQSSPSSLGQSPFANLSASSSRTRASQNSARLQRSLKSTNVELWTNLPTKHNPSAQWHAEPMELVMDSELDPHLVPDGFEHISGMFRARIYSLTLIGVSPGDYEATYRLLFWPSVNKADSDQPNMKWLGKPGLNIKLQVHPSNLNDKWTQYPEYRELLPIRNLFIANFRAANRASKYGFTSVVSLAYEIPPLKLNETSGNEIDLLRLPLLDGSANAIPKQSILEAVEWIDLKLSEGKKVCIHDRASLGRAGSIAIAMFYKRYSHFTFEQACQSAWAIKTSIYPHTQLRESLEELFPRISSIEITKSPSGSKKSLLSSLLNPNLASKSMPSPSVSPFLNDDILAPITYGVNDASSMFSNDSIGMSAQIPTGTDLGNWPMVAPAALGQNFSGSSVGRKLSFSRLYTDEDLTNRSGRRTSRSPSRVRLVKKSTDN